MGCNQCDQREYWDYDALEMKMFDYFEHYIPQLRDTMDADWYEHVMSFAEAGYPIEAFRWALELVKKPVSKELVLELHEVVAPLDSDIALAIDDLTFRFDLDCGPNYARQLGERFYPQLAPYVSEGFDKEFGEWMWEIRAGVNPIICALQGIEQPLPASLVQEMREACAHDAWGSEGTHAPPVLLVLDHQVEQYGVLPAE